MVDDDDSGSAPDRGHYSRSPDHVVDAVIGGRSSSLAHPHDDHNKPGGSKDDDDIDQKQSDDGVPEDHDDDAPLRDSVNEYAAVGSGSESDFGGAALSWLNASDDDKGGGGEALLGRMFTQPCVQIPLSEAHEFLGGSRDASSDLSDVRRNLFPKDSLTSSSSASSSSAKESESRGRRRPATSLRMSIEKIREEASRVDTVLALDKLETVQQELEETRRQLQNRRQELDEQRVVIKLKDDRLATLELERDLYKADASLRSNQHRPPWRRHGANSTTGSASEASRSSVPRILERHHLPPPLHDEQPSHLSSKARDLLPASLSSSDSDSSSLDSSVNRGDRLYDSNLRRTSALEAKCLLGTKRLASILVARRKREKGRTSSMTETTTLPSPLAQPKSKPCKIHGLRNQTQTATLQEEWVQNHRPPDTWSLENQIEDLQERLRASMETADELRRRLASVHGFYEKTIQTLQARWQASERWNHHRYHYHPSAEAAAAQEQGEEEAWRAQVDHIQHAKRRVVDALEAKLREKDDEIERLSTLAYDEI